MNGMIAAFFTVEGPDVAQEIANELDYFGIAGFDGAFIAWQAEPVRDIATAMDQLADTIAAIGAAIATRAHQAAQMR